VSRIGLDLPMLTVRNHNRWEEDEAVRSGLDFMQSFLYILIGVCTDRTILADGEVRNVEE
jgi:hypothetical protein